MLIAVSCVCVYVCICVCLCNIYTHTHAFYLSDIYTVAFLITCLHTCLPEDAYTYKHRLKRNLILLFPSHLVKVLIKSQ